MTSTPGAATRRVLTVPNVLSFVRLGTVPIFVWLFVSGRTEAAVILYAVGASTDWLDGYLARRMDAVSELGRLLDPVADRIFIAALAVALVGAGELPLAVAAALVARDALLVGGWLLLEGRGSRAIPVSLPGKVATAALLTGLTLMAVAATSWGFGESWRTAGLILVLIGTALYWVVGAAYARRAFGP
ncbi:MAG: CDP-alcohol phosphatidyltransferase family protein [Actinobacteria bacterium]|nr:CDP-alcohol phosphatidyltransferase family protein [Actinomycetota bacterium]